MSYPRALIIVKSIHHQNTVSIAQTVARVLQAKVAAPEELSPQEAGQYDLLGVGSGIYFGRFHRTVRQWILNLPRPSKECSAFVFSTSGLPFLESLWHAPIHRALRQGLPSDRRLQLPWLRYGRTALVDRWVEPSPSRRSGSCPCRRLRAESHRPLIRTAIISNSK